MPDNVMLIELPDPNDPGRTIVTPVVVPEGRLEALAQEDPRLAASFRPASEEELRGIAREQDIDRRRQVIQESPIFSRLAAFGINFANEMALGIPGRLMGEDERRTFEATQRELPGTSAAGTLAGVLAPAFATGGASLGEVGAARLLPGVAAQATGNTVERALMQRLVSRGLSEGQARVLARMGGNAVDGSLSGIQAAITNANIEGSPLDAESIVANGLIGAGLGLGTGALFSARLGRRGREQAESLVENGLGPRGVEVLDDGSIRMVDQVNPEANGLLSNMATSRVARTISGFTGETDAEDMRKLLRPGAMQEAQVGRSYSEETVRLSMNTEAALNEARDRYIDRMRSAEFRQSRFAELGPDADEAALAFRENMGAMAQELDDLVGRKTTRRIARAGKMIDEAVETAGSAGRRLTPQAIKQARELSDLVRDASSASNAADLARRLDNLLDRVRTNKLDEKFKDPVLAAAVHSTITQAEQALTKLGPAGAAAVAAQRAVREYDRAVQDLRGAAIKHNISLDEERINPGALFASVADAGYRVKLDLTNDFTHLNDVVARAGRTAQENYGIDTSDIHARLVESTRGFSEARRKGELIAIYRDLSGRESRGSALFAALGMSGAGMGATVGGLVAGVPGALIGGGVALAFTAASHPLSMMQRLAFLGGAKRATQERLTGEVSNLRKALERGARAVNAGRLERAIPKTLRALYSQEQRRQEYKEITNQLRELASNPEALMDTLADVTDGPSDVSPELGTYIAGTYVRAVQYLASELPPADQVTPFSHLRDLEPSMAEISSFVRKYEALEDPLGIIRMAAEYRLTADHVAAVRSVYPELFTMIQAEITNMLGDLQKLPPYSARMMVGTLLDVPADPSLDPQFIFRLQQRYAQTSQQQQEAGPQRTTTGVTRIAGNTYSASQSLQVRLQGGQ